MHQKTYEKLNQHNALIWRIIHRNNFSWVLQHGMHAGNSKLKSNNWIDIGNQELIERRLNSSIPIAPQKTLNDCIPFYFTPFSPMLYNIQTGYGGVQQRNAEDIIILVSDLHRMKTLNLNFIFTNMHAYSSFATFYNELKDLDKIDWEILQRRDFQRDNDDPNKVLRYQAEALIYNFCPVEAMRAVICYNDSVKQELDILLQTHSMPLKTYSRRGWYFR